MGNAIQLLGFVMILQGISGAIDHLARPARLRPVPQPLQPGRHPRVEFLSGYELLANLTLAVLGFAVLALTDRAQPS